MSTLTDASLSLSLGSEQRVHFETARQQHAKSRRKPTKKETTSLSGAPSITVKGEAKEYKESKIR